MAQVKIDIREIKKLKGLKGKGARIFAEESRKVLRELGEDIIDSFIRDRLSGNPIGQKTGKLASRKSFKVKIRGVADTSLEIALQGRQVKLLEEGGWIHAKRTKYLAIPTDNALDSRGLPKWDGPLTYPFADTDRLVKTNSGYLVFGPDNNLYYVYKESVYVKPRLGFGIYMRSAKVARLIRGKVKKFRDAMKERLL